MIMPNGRVECDWCDQLAAWRLEAQWTLVDWDWADCCGQHLPHAQLALDHLVDGQPVQEWHIDDMTGWERYRLSMPHQLG